MEALAIAIEFAKGATKLAAGIGVSQSAPHMWLQRGKVPEENHPSIERFTRGLVTCEQLAGADSRWKRRVDPEAPWPWHPDGKPLLDVLPAPIGADPAPQPAEPERAGA